jgi:hypothetical protein
MDFPLGWPVIPAANVRRSRPLVGGATAVVGVGEQVRPDQVVAERPGADGEQVGVVAGLAGRVTQVLPGRSVTIDGVATTIQGIFGLGGPAAGALHFLPRGESLAVAPIPRHSIVVFPAQLPLTLLQRAAGSGAAGIVAAGMAVRELESFARADLSAALEGHAPEAVRLPLTLLFTEGVGSSTMDSAIFKVLSQRAGDIALLTGTTDPRRNVRPEILLPLPLGTAAVATPADDAIIAGARVRVVAGPWRGMRGETAHVFARRQVTDLGLLARAARVRLEDGTSPVVPFNFLERIG